MKKIYMILAAITLLSMSLNAQRLPANKLGGFDFTPTGTAHHKAPGSQFRMPSLNSGEYIFGPYNTDDFDATGISYGGYYSSAQQIVALVDLTREEFESHLGDTIIGFRFALAGSTATRVYDFMAWPGNESYWDNADYRHTWSLGDLVAGNTSSETQTITVMTPTDVTFNQASDYGSTSVSKDGITITTTNGNLASNYNQYRFYSGSTTTFSTNSGTITKIVFTTSSGYSTSVLSPSTGSISGNTWTGNASSVNFTASGQYRCTRMVVTVERPTTTTTTVNTVDIGRGTVQDEELPAYGFWHDMGYKNQMIYRAEQLAMASGAQITAVTYYPEEGIGIPFGGSTVTVSLANTTTENFGTGTTGNMITSGFTTVATIVPVEDETVTAWTINFDTPFTYTGGNLVVQVNSPGQGDFGHCYFYGDNQSSNVSIKVSGVSAQTATSGPTSKFLPKTTFTFTGNINAPTYMTLQGGEWHDFFLDEPVVFEVSGDSITSLAIGYTYWQLASTSHAPTAVNSNSIGHGHESYMATNSYSSRWWNDGISGPDNTDRPGDMAVQLIFKQAKPKTPSPTIEVTYDNGYYYITATADPSTPNAQVTLNVGGQTASAPGSVTIPVGRIYGQDQTVTATATAIETGMLVSDPTTQTVNVQASTLEPTPTPTITPTTLDATVQITGSGQGDVHMYIDGKEVSYPDAYVERTEQDYYVTVTVTAQINDGEHAMSTTTQQVLIPALADLDLTGWTRLPGTFTNDKVINWNDNLLFIDRFTESTADNNQPLSYTYVMTEDPIKLIGAPRTTNDHTIPVQATRSKVWGYYTEQQVIDDTLRQIVDTCLINADVEMNVEKKSAIYYYTLDRSRNSILDDNFLELSELQFDGNRYVEHDNFFTWQEPFNFEGDATTRAINRFDTINQVLPASAPQGDEGKHYGKYDNNDYLAYVPIVWTWGNDDTNMRAFWDRDSVHNSYGSPIWKTSVGKVDLIGQPKLERQDGKDGSTNWEEIVGNDTIPCSIFMITDLTAHGFLPKPEVSNIKYEPYMFRVWVMSDTTFLRKFQWVDGDPDDIYQRPGTHFEGRGTIPANEPFLVWEEFIADSTTNISYDGIHPDMTIFHKSKIENWATDTTGDVHFVTPQDMNMLFAAQDNLTSSHLTIFVRFYYKSTGEALHQNDNQNGMLLMANRAGGGNGFYGVEGEGDPDPDIPTFIKGVYTSTDHGEVVSTTYYNLQGMQSSQPFQGINIVVTRYSDGTYSTQKVMRR